MGEFEKRILEYSEKNQIPLNDYEGYIGRMSKSIWDKCWWVDKIEDSINTIIDFGCGDGELGKFLERVFPGRFYYIGIDNNPNMIELARQNLVAHPKFYLCSSLQKAAVKINADLDIDITILVMNSVIHELLHYLPLEDSATILTEIIELAPCYITIRDMHCYLITEFADSLRDKAVVTLQDISLRSKGAISGFFIDFMGKSHYAEPVNLLLEWCLKYRYTANWDRESKERYLFNWIEPVRQGFLSYSYKLVYEMDFFIPFIYNKFKEDFGIEMLPIPSHKKILIRKDDQKK
jgi:SAM-dependent methyltransferase